MARRSTIERWLPGNVECDGSALNSKFDLDPRVRLWINYADTRERWRGGCQIMHRGNALLDAVQRCSEERGWALCRCMPLCVLLGSMSCAGDEDCSQQLQVCDIRQRACQEAVASAVVCMRGGAASVPPVELVSEAQFLTLGGESEPDSADELRYASWTRGLSLFRLSAPEVDRKALDLQVVAKVGAAYLSREHRIVVIDRGEPMRSMAAVELLVHELVHAMQFAEHDFDAMSRDADTTFDSRLALRGLIEGEAVHYESLAAAQLRGFRPEALLWKTFYNDWQAKTLIDAEADAQPLEMAYFRFPYAFGGRFATAVWLARGAGGLRAMLEQPPRTTRELLFGPAAVDLDAERRTLDATAAPVLPTNFEPASHSHLGAWIARMFTARIGVPISLRLLGPQSLASDVLSVYRDVQTDNVIATWRVRLLPQSGVGAWPHAEPPIESWSDAGGGDVFLVAQSSPATIVPRRLAWRALPEEPAPAMMPSMMNGPRSMPALLPCVARTFPIDPLLVDARRRP